MVPQQQVLLESPLASWQLEPLELRREPQQALRSLQQLELRAQGRVVERSEWAQLAADGWTRSLGAAP